MLKEEKRLRKFIHACTAYPENEADGFSLITVFRRACYDDAAKVAFDWLVKRKLKGLGVAAAIREKGE